MGAWGGWSDGGDGCCRVLFTQVQCKQVNLSSSVIFPVSMILVKTFPIGMPISQTINQLIFCSVAYAPQMEILAAASSDGTVKKEEDFFSFFLTYSVKRIDNMYLCNNY